MSVEMLTDVRDELVAQLERLWTYEWKRCPPDREKETCAVMARTGFTWVDGRGVPVEETLGIEACAALLWCIVLLGSFDEKYLVPVSGQYRHPFEAGEALLVVGHWNDDDQREFAEVVELFEETIKRVEMCIEAART